MRSPMRPIHDNPRMLAKGAQTSAVLGAEGNDRAQDWYEVLRPSQRRVHDHVPGLSNCVGALSTIVVWSTLPEDPRCWSIG